MALLFRVLLISLLIYLVVKLVRDWISGPAEDDQKVKSSDKTRKVSRDVGEYVDFEEINEDERRKEKDERRPGEKNDRVSDKKKGTRDFR